MFGIYEQVKISTAYTAADDPIKGEKAFLNTGKILYEITKS